MKKERGHLYWLTQHSIIILSRTSKSSVFVSFFLTNNNLMPTEFLASLGPQQIVTVNQ